MNQSLHIPKWANIYCSIAILIFCSLSLIIRSGYSVGALLLFMGGIYAIFADKKKDLSKRDIFLLCILVFFTFEGVLNNVVHGASASSYDKIIRIILVIPVFFLVRWSKPKEIVVWLSVVIGASLAGILAIYEKFFLGIGRVGGANNPIQFGNLALLMGFFCLAGMGWAISQPKGSKRNLYIILLILGALSGVLASLLSGSRGGWVGIPFVLLVLFKAYHNLYSIRTKLIAFFVAILTIFVMFNTPSLHVKDRVDAAVHDIEQYKIGNTDTSVGLRFEVWRGAALLIKEKPIMGWGKDGYRTGMQDIVNNYDIAPRVASFGHAHNEIIDKTAKQGLLGFISLMLLYLVPIWYFSPYLKHQDYSIRALAAAGTILPVAYIDFGLTQGFMSHNSGVMMFAVWLMLWAAYLKNRLVSSTIQS